MDKFINNRAAKKSALYPDNIISDFFSYMPRERFTSVEDDEKWLENFVNNECISKVELFDGADREGFSETFLCAEYPEDLALFVMRAEIRKQQYG